MNYIEVLGAKFPNVQAHCVGDPTNFEDIVYDGGDPMPTAEQFTQADREMRQRIKWEEIAAERDRRYEQGVYLDVNGTSYWFWTDGESKQNYSIYDIMIRANSLPPDYVLDQWKTMEHLWVPMTVALLYRVIAGGVQVVKTIFATAEQKKQAMLSLDDPDTYDALSGWPQCFSDVYPNGAPDSYPPMNA